MSIKQALVGAVIIVISIMMLNSQIPVADVSDLVSTHYILLDPPDPHYKVKERELEGTPIFAVPRSFTLEDATDYSNKSPIKSHKTVIPNPEVDHIYLSINAGPDCSKYTYHVILDGVESPIPSQLFNPEGKAIVGPYTAKNIILVQDAMTPKSPNLSITEVYTTIDGNRSMMETGFGASFTCNGNVTCDNRSLVSTIEKSVVRVLLVLEEGLGFCCGSLMNNAKQDSTPYVLSGFHCQEGFTPRYNLWRFDFFFQSESCVNPNEEPPFRSLTGCRQVAGRQESDFLLLEMLSDIPQDFVVYYNGWNIRDDHHPEPAIMIHHPAGDIKKISYENDDLRVLNSGINWDNEITTPRSHHFIAELDNGTHQPGSSGAPLFDTDGRVIGQLHGGIIDDGECRLTRAYYGRIQKSWDAGTDPSTRLKDWLDPLCTGRMTQDGMLHEIINTTINYNIRIATSQDVPLNAVTLSLSGEVDETLVTNADGSVMLPNIPSNSLFTISASKNSQISNGLSVTDLVQVRNHILDIATLDDDIKLLAADVNGNGSISVTDMVQIRNVILGIWDEFPNTDSWEFLPSEQQVGGDINNTEINFTGYKIGDVNFSADPSN